MNRDKIWTQTCYVHTHTFVDGFSQIHDGKSLSKHCEHLKLAEKLRNPHTFRSAGRSQVTPSKAFTYNIRVFI